MRKSDSLKIVLIIAADGVRRWHGDLAGRLRDAGFLVGLRLVPAGAQMAGADLAIALAALTRRGVTDALQTVLPEAIAPRDDGEADVCLCLGVAGGQSQGRIFQVVYNGVAQEDQAVAGLLRGRLAVVAVVAVVDGRGATLAQGLPSVEYPSDLGLAAGQFFHRVQDLVIKALTQPETVPAPAPVRQPELSRVEAITLSASRFGRKLVSRAIRPLRRADHWQAGWRATRGDALPDKHCWPDADYLWLADDKRRFYADPFVFEHAGQMHLFVEEFPYATGKGVLSHCVLAGQGGAAPRVILEEPFHLSYPQVFARDGAIWMIPETAQAGAIRLYRASAFPERWEHVADLVAGAWSDATLVEHAGCLWLFATDSAPPGSTWDSLHLFRADALMGPWTPHPANPVLVDARAARPAGPMFHRQGSLWRPVQDCSTGYGAALGLARVDRLDETGYGQTLVTHLAPPARWRANGAHTLGQAGGIEVVDRVRPLWGWRR